MEIKLYLWILNKSYREFYIVLCNDMNLRIIGFGYKTYFASKKSDDISAWVGFNTLLPISLYLLGQFLSPHHGHLVSLCSIKFDNCCIFLFQILPYCKKSRMWCQASSFEYLTRPCK